MNPWKLFTQFREGKQTAGVAEVTTKKPASILDRYLNTLPTPQNAVDIFGGEWASQFPESVAAVHAGTIPLFDDARVHWWKEMVGGFDGQTVLELGPLEGGHSYMLERYGAQSVLAIEANTRAYLRCLITKEILELKRVRFVCGDFMEYMRQEKTQFDLGVASGVLYHMSNPIEMLGLLTRLTRKHIFLWTHYYQ